MANRTISHIINPVNAKSGTHLHVAQPVTFETMRIAKAFSRKCSVELLSVQFSGDGDLAPAGFARVPDFDRSILDVKSFNKQRELPLISDIFDRLYEESSGDYLVYTNVDIALQPFFYDFVSTIIDKEGHDAFIINRRTISDNLNDLSDVHAMYSSIGEKHPGWDCFVFRRDLYPKFNLGLGVIGQGWIGRIILSNLILHAESFKIYKDRQLTFHLGNDETWKNPDYRDYQEHNIRECKKVLAEYEDKHGKLDRNSIPGKFFNLEPDVQA